ncbi:MAG TPA: T9SS type A sorting domain-containing protein [Chitinophagales bacterium]|nr:T9SS type A sorting domain-containing protein [Chitinophagales bacterium]
MKRFTAVVVFVMMVFIGGRSWGQNLGDYMYTLNFEDTATLHHLIIDSTFNHNNLWQVGSPNKPIFTSAYFSLNAIVTDTANPYPINDTSSFEIINVVNGGGWLTPYVAIFGGDYEVNSDTLSDYGKIEFTLDNGYTWININDVPNYGVYLGWDSPIPILSGNSNGWKGFQVNLAGLGPMYGVQLGDTIRYRFTFISDSIQTNKDGLIFDNLHFEDWVEGIQEIQNGNLFSLSPNPVQNLLTINFPSPSAAATIAVYDVAGRKIVLPTTYSNNKAELTTTTLPNGIYLLQIINNITGVSEVGKFVKE